MAHANIYSFFFFFNDPATPEIYTLPLHDALPIFLRKNAVGILPTGEGVFRNHRVEVIVKHEPASREFIIERKRSEEHTSELQSRQYLVCRLLLEKKQIRQYHACRLMLEKNITT